MVQLGHGSDSMPSCWGKVYMIYRSVMKPGASIVAHPIFPGMLKRDGWEVLPAGYHSIIHWATVNYFSVD